MELGREGGSNMKNWESVYWVLEELSRLGGPDSSAAQVTWVPSSVLVYGGKCSGRDRRGEHCPPVRELLPGLVDKFQAEPQSLDSGAAEVEGRKQPKSWIHQ